MTWHWLPWWLPINSQQALMCLQDMATKTAYMCVWKCVCVYMWVFGLWIECIIHTWENLWNVCLFVRVHEWSSSIGCLCVVQGTVRTLKKSSLVKLFIWTHEGGVRSTAKMCEKDYNARWRVQMCRFSIYNVSMTLELYLLGLHSYNNALYHIQMPTHTCFLAQMTLDYWFFHNNHQLTDNKWKACRDCWPLTVSVRCVSLCVCLC